jgi:uncharacterized protein YecE (DUF72 family)
VEDDYISVADMGIYHAVPGHIDLWKWPDMTKQNLEAIGSLQRAGRSEVVLFQFPYSIRYEPENRRYPDKCLTCFKEVQAAVAFRTVEC